MARGTCTYNDSLHDLFFKKGRVFSFESCPYLSDSSLRFYKLTNVFGIFGPTRSGKTLLLSHIIFDLLKSNTYFGKIVLIDTDLGFDFETLKAKMESTEPDISEEDIDSLLSNLLYLPVRNSYEFGLVMNSLELCLNNGSLLIHSLVIDSVSSLYTMSFSDVLGSNVTKGVDKIFNQILSMCRKHSIFFIYTNDIDSYLYKRTFYVELEHESNYVENKNDIIMDDQENEDMDSVSPRFPVEKEDMIYENIFSNDLLISFGSNNSNDYKYEHYGTQALFDMEYEHRHVPEVEKALPIENQTIIKSFIPENWIVKPANESTKDNVFILLSHTRISDKNYITFVSRDPRGPEFRNQTNFLTQMNGNNTIERMENKEKNDKSDKNGSNLVNGLDKEGENKNTNNNNNNNNKEVTHLIIKDMNEVEMKHTPKKRFLEKSVDVELLKKHDFRVYRIDSQTTYTRCSYETVNFD